MNDDGYLAFDARRYGAMKRLVTNMGRGTCAHVEAGAVPGLALITRRKDKSAVNRDRMHGRQMHVVLLILSVFSLEK